MKTNINPRLYLFAALLLLMASCKLDKPDFSGYNKIDSTGNPGNPVLSDTYQPVNKGSYWKYKNVIGTETDTTTAVLTGESTVINNRTYYEGVGTSTVQPYNDTSYLSRDNHIYTTLSTTGGVVVELYYLNDTTAVGHGWVAPINSTGSILGIPGQFVGKILKRGISKTVSGKTFANVIHSQVLLQYDYGSGFSTYITYDNYVARGIGIIEVDTNGSGITDIETLYDYSIK